MSIAQNKKAFHDYFVEQKFETGIVLEGWEVKAIRAGRVQLKEAYGTRKLLLHTEEINRLIGSVERAGYTLLPLDMHYTRGRIKLAVGLAKGKKQHDKRQAEKERDWQREKQRLLKVK